MLLSWTIILYSIGYKSSERRKEIVSSNSKLKVRDQSKINSRVKKPDTANQTCKRYNQE